MKTLEWQYDDTTSFFGRLDENSEVQDFHVMAKIAGLFESVKMLSDRMEIYYKREFQVWAMAQKKKELDRGL